MAQELKHDTMNELVEEIYSEIVKTTERLLSNEIDNNFLRGEIVAYRKVLRMLHIPEIKLSVSKGEVRQLD